MIALRLNNIIKIVITLFLISTSILKIISFPQLVFIVHNYNILPQALVLPLSILIITVEIFAWVGLLCLDRFTSGNNPDIMDVLVQVICKYINR